MQIKYPILFILVMALFFSCSFKRELPESFIADIENTAKKFVPDKRTKVFQINYEYGEEHNKWIIEGETTEEELLRAIDSIANKYFDQDEVSLNMQLLPQSALKDTIYGLVKVSVGNLKKHPKHSAELVDQALMGTTLKLLKRLSYWYMVQTPTDYLGWITVGTVEELTENELEEWLQAEKSTLNVNFAQVFSAASTNSPVVCDAVLGCTFKKRERQGDWQEVELPDGRVGFIKQELIGEPVEIDNSKYPSREAVIALAKNMMGIPYIWGGNSTKGFDCSGFTSTIFRSLGYLLPRDANMQVELGLHVVPKDDYSNVLPGDMIFFGPENLITHVGICLGGSYFIHCSDDVHINSLDEQDELYNQYRKRTYSKIKRIIID